MTPEGRIIFVQPSLANYRIGFFERLHRHYGDRLKLFSASSGLGVLTDPSQSFPWNNYTGPITNPLPGVEWQRGVNAVTFHRGDTFVASGAPRCLSNLTLVAKAKVSGAKVVWWGHYWSSTSKGWRARIRHRLMRICDGVLFYTEQELAAFRSETRYTRAPISAALNNGMDLKAVAELRTRYNAKARGRSLLCIGRMTEKVQLQVLLQSLLKVELKDVELHIIGDGPAKPQWVQFASENGLASRVHWHAGTTDEEFISKIANQCALFVFPGATGLSLIHAFGYGLPAIIHNDRRQQGPEVDALVSGKNGFHFEISNPGSLANVIASSLADSDNLNRLSAAAIETVTTSFNVDDMAQRLICFVDELNGTTTQ